MRKDLTTSHTKGRKDGLFLRRLKWLIAEKLTAEAVTTSRYYKKSLQEGFLSYAEDYNERENGGGVIRGPIGGVGERPLQL